MGFYLKVAGVTFDNRQQVIAKLKQNQNLMLVREPNDKLLAVKRCGEPWDILQRIMDQ